MLSYLIRRSLIGALTLLIITFLVYGMIRNMPGNPLTQEMSRLDPGKTISADDLERLKRIYGLDKPWYQAYFVWAKNVAGDRGRSARGRRAGRSGLRQASALLPLGSRWGRCAV